MTEQLCDSCKHRRPGLYERGEGWCYMFRTAPPALRVGGCPQYRITGTAPAHILKIIERQGQL